MAVLQFHSVKSKLKTKVATPEVIDILAKTEKPIGIATAHGPALVHGRAKAIGINYNTVLLILSAQERKHNSGSSVD